MTAISASEARQTLFPLIRRVVDDHEPVEITSKSGNVVMMSADDFDSWQETVYLLRNPANAVRLMTAVNDIRSGLNLSETPVEDLEQIATQDQGEQS